MFSGGPEVERGGKFLDFDENFNACKIKFRDPFDHIQFFGKLLVSSNGLIPKTHVNNFIFKFSDQNNWNFKDGRHGLTNRVGA